MNLKFWTWGSPQQNPYEAKHAALSKDITSNYRHVHTFSKSFNGEKNLGELGPAIHYDPHFQILSIRSWQSYLESEISHTIINKYIKWIIDRGLSLKASPNKTFLDLEGVEISDQQLETFSRSIEARWKVWATSRKVSKCGLKNLNNIAKDVFKHSRIGGDCLVILRYVNGILKVELVDGFNIETPIGSALDSNIRNGVEYDAEGAVVAYHVRVKRDTVSYGYERILAKSDSTGLHTAFMVYGRSYRVDSSRGLPIIAVSLESLSKIERYKEAAVGSAEERQKIVYYISHGNQSTGTSPFQESVLRAVNGGGGANDGIALDAENNKLADTVAVSTNKKVFNMTPDSELKQLESKNEMFFKEFYGSNADIICAAFGIPPNVAFSIYNDSFSASRAATKDWDHTIQVDREDFQEQFYQPVYDFFQFIQVAESKVIAPGYLSNWKSKNDLVLEAYQKCRFTGPYFPHIDPVKEVKAERLKLGPQADNLPLTDITGAIERLDGGDVKELFKKFAEEIKEADESGLIPKEKEETPTD